jgi:hypothetical protein
MDDSRILVELSRDIAENFADNGIDIARELRAQGLEVQRGNSNLDGLPTEGGKEVALALVGVGITVMAIATGITKIIDALGRNQKIAVTHRVLKPALDPNGTPIHTPDGKPVMYWADETQLLEARQTRQDQTRFEAHVGGPSLLSFSIGPAQE